MRSARWCSLSRSFARRRSRATSPSWCAAPRGGRAEVTVQARYPEHKPAPVSGVSTQEIYTLHGRAVALEGGTRHMVGVSATGITACPARRARRGPRARAPIRAGGLLRGTDRAHPRRGSGRHAQPAWPRHAADRLPGGLRRGDRRQGAAGDRGGLDVIGDLRADEALRRGRGRREGPPPSTLRRGLRARDGRGRRATFSVGRRELHLRAPWRRAETKLAPSSPGKAATTPATISRTQSSTKRGRRWAFSTTSTSSERFISS